MEPGYNLPGPSVRPTGGMAKVAQPDMISQILNITPQPASSEPFLVIVEQPKQKDHRFRYRCEGRTAGSLLGENSGSSRKKYPEVKLHNLTCRAEIVVSLVTVDDTPKPHPYSLVGSECQDGIVRRVVTPRMPSARFTNVGIQCVTKKDIKSSLQKRKDQGVDPYNNIVELLNSESPEIDFKTVRLCFQAFLEDPNQPNVFNKGLSPVLSQRICNKKDSNLKICRINKTKSSVRGKEEVYILCEKVDRDDVQVIFSCPKEDGKGEWQGYASFGPTDVHHQVAIRCHTPPFYNQAVTHEVSVKVVLKRPSDGDTSNSIDFKYLPTDFDSEGIQAKRAKNSPHFESYIKSGSLKGTSEQNTATGSSHFDIKKALRAKIQAKKDGALMIKQPQSPFSFPSISDAMDEFSSQETVTIKNENTMTFGQATVTSPTLNTTSLGQCQIPSDWMQPHDNNNFSLEMPLAGMSPSSAAPVGDTVTVSLETINMPIFLNCITSDQLNEGALIGSASYVRSSDLSTSLRSSDLQRMVEDLLQNDPLFSQQSVGQDVPEEGD